MPPSTRQSGQKRKASTRPNADPNLPDSSPSKPPAKRRKAPATTTRRRPKTPEVEPEDNDSGDETSSEAEVQTQADAIIPHLAVAKYQVNAAVQYSNSRVEGASQKVQAYAKVSGRHWTYYVRNLSVVIGRPPDPVSHHDSSPTPRGDSPDVQIDLGPSRAVSRFHAELFYAMDDQQWHIDVKGRNPIQLNDTRLLRGERSVVGSGDILEIAGTQMIFVTAEGKASVHHSFISQLEMHAHCEGISKPAALSHAHPPTAYAAPSSPSLQRAAAAAFTSSQPIDRMALTPALPDLERPMTPDQSPQRQPRPSSAVKQSPMLGRGFMIESTEQIDYSSDATKDLKPSIPYSVMITQAILSSPDETKTLNGIYDWIKKQFAYYRYLETNWQNSIRHVLSLNVAFTKVPRGPNEPGKGMKWAIEAEKRYDMVQAVTKHVKKSNTRQSLPNSPATLRDDSNQVPYAPSAPVINQSSEANGVFKTSPPARTPPLNTYPTAQESYTPSRGPRLTTLANYDHSDNLPALSDDPSPLPIRRNNLKVGATDSSPVLPSSYFDGSMMTPAPRQYNLNIPLPNTIKLPTSHMPDSSPAPFWKYERYGEGSILGSTPAKWSQTSPIKDGMGLGLGLQSSSPPPPASNGNESPTKSRGPRSAMDVNIAGEVAEMDDEEGGFDLKRGFASISKFHQEMSAATAGNAA
ncbi:MAG: hypothetical protein Q9218_002208 [Villophora microphyllina]